MIKILFQLVVFVFRISDDVSNAYAKKLPMKSQWKAIVEKKCRAGRDSLLQNKWMTTEQWSSHINDSLPLAGAAGSPSLVGSALPLSGGIRINFNNQHILINGNNLHCAIHYDPILKLHKLDGKHNSEDIYHNNIAPPVVS